MATYTINLPEAAMPTFGPAAGTYAAAQTVTMSDSTAGAIIHYTTDGSTPTVNSPQYTGAITVGTSETIKAIAIATGYSDSTVASATYTIDLAAATTPVFAPPGGTYISAQTVAITDTTPGATIYYTTDGSTPTASSTKYTGPITVSASETIKAIAAATGFGNSAIASAIYTITPPAATPVISPPGGTYTAAQSVTITDTTPGAIIYYTINGTTPTTSSTKYSGTITVGSSETIQTIAVANQYSASAVASAAYTIDITQPVTATPTFSPAAGTYSTAQSVTISDATAGAVIYYTTNGTPPTTSSTKYSGPITAGATETLEAMAIASGDSPSMVASAIYTISLPVAATPSFSPAAGTYTSVQTVTVNDTTAAATIFYTTDGSTPTTSSTQYTAPISVGSSETLEAIAVASGYTNSAVGTAAYTINPPAGGFALAASPSSATVTAGQSAQFTLTVTPQNGFAQAVALSCSGLPEGDSCSFAPATVTPAGVPVTSALTIAAAANTAMTAPQPLPLWTKLVGGISLALLLWPVRRRRVWPAFVLSFLLGASFAIIGCGGSARSQIYIVSVNASSRSITQSATVTLTVKK
jgi:hypothetical protein